MLEYSQVKLNNRAFIPPCLYDLLLEHPVVLEDVGAAGGIHERWSCLGSGLKVLGFELEQSTYQALPRKPNRIWVNAALGDRECEARLLVTRHQTKTSQLTPNRRVIDYIYLNPADFDVMKEVIVPCTTLDELSRIENLEVTALKADTQGTELSILRGAEKCL